MLGGTRFKDAFDALQALKEKKNIKITVFSNGSSPCLGKERDLYHGLIIRSYA